MMDLGLKGRTAMVTASSKGIGFSIAKALASEGCKVAICARDEENLSAARAEIEELGGTVFAKKCDLTVPEDIGGFVNEAEKNLGPIDILVANAGGPPSGTFDKLSSADWDKAVQLNLNSVVILCRHILPGMKSRKWGRIITLTSVSVKEPIENLMLSNSVRLAVVGFSKTLSQEVGLYNITVNCIAPGYTATERLNSLASSLAEKKGVSPQEISSGWTASVPLGRLGKPEEVANLAVFLSSNAASYITGTTIQVDGGMVRSSL